MVTKEQVEAVLRQHVLERGPWRADQVELTLRAFPPLSVPDGEVDVQVLKPTDGITPGQRRFLLAITLNGEEKERRWVQAELRVFDDVIVAARSLAYHETITSDDIRMGRRELNTFSLRAVTDPREVVGRHAARTIEMNEVLTPAMVSLPQVVQRGNRVSLVFESAGLRVEIAGRAMQAGKMGERIRVENTASGKIVEGQILDAHTVKVN
jgi:flagella basal body P-ring formation protein FlgA